MKRHHKISKYFLDYLKDREAHRRWIIIDKLILAPRYFKL